MGRHVEAAAKLKGDESSRDHVEAGIIFKVAADEESLQDVQRGYNNAVVVAQELISEMKSLAQQLKQLPGLPVGNFADTLLATTRLATH